MSLEENIQSLVGKYLPQIVIEDSDFVPADDCPSDISYLSLIIPITFLEEYQKLNCKTGHPEGYEFWKNTRLKERLKDVKEVRYHQPLETVLDFLDNKVDVKFYPLNDQTRVRMAVYEIPKETYHSETD